MFKWLLFDADNTLLDFSGASKKAFWETLIRFEISCNEDRYGVFQKVNKGVWEDFEQGKISAERLRIKRFELLFEALEETAPDPVLASKTYLSNLVSFSEAYQGSLELLHLLKTRYRLSLVTNGLKEVQRPRLDKVNMTSCFESIIVSDEVGVAKPDTAYFELVFDSISAPPPREEVLIIGDNLQSDIKGGKDFGIKTCWVTHGRANSSAIHPDFQINTVLELPSLLD